MFTTHCIPIPAAPDLANRQLDAAVRAAVARALTRADGSVARHQAVVHAGAGVKPHVHVVVARG